MVMHTCDPGTQGTECEASLGNPGDPVPETRINSTAKNGIQEQQRNRLCLYSKRVQGWSQPGQHWPLWL